MRERINRLAKGLLDPEALRLVISPEELTDTVYAGEVTRKTITVADEESRFVKGLVYSSNIRVRVANNAFGGVRNRITFEIDSMYLTQKDVITGAFYLVTNAGERKVPYSFSIAVEASGRTLESLNTVEDFAELARKDQETALRLFEYQDFVEAPFMQDIHTRALYDGLKSRGNRQNLLEEFLVALKAKEPVRLEVESHHLSFERQEKPTKQWLEVHASTWGYVQFQVSADGDFLELPKKFFTLQDFKDGVCQVGYIVNPARLHGGRNLGAFLIATIRDFQLVHVEAQGGDEELRLPRSTDRENLGHYLALRLQYELELLKQREKENGWQRQELPEGSRQEGSSAGKLLMGQMRQETENLRRANGETPLIVLLQAELAILEGQDSRADGLLENRRGELLDLRRDKPELYCFYQYLLHIQNKKEGQKESLVRLVKRCLLDENGHPYLFLLWLKLEPGLRENPAELLERMRRFFEQGCSSPFLYAQAFFLYRKEPHLIHRLGKFEIQVLNFAIRRELLERDVAVRISELAGAVKTYSRSGYRLLAALYEKYPEKEFLSAVCGMLIRGDCRDEKYFPWYEKALKAGVSLTGLYEYYLYSIPKDYPYLLPKEVLLYFSYEKSMDDYSRSLLYMNILKYMNQDSELYKQYERDIEKFTMEQLLSARVNRRLVVLYQHMLYKEMIDQRVARVLPAVLRSCRIKIDNPNIKYVVVCYEELEEEDAFLVKDGMAYVPLFREHSVILFQDGFGNRYANISCEKLLAMEKKDVRELLDRCYEVYPGHEMLRLQECGDIVDKGVSGEEDVMTLERISSDLKFKSLYRRRILSRIIQYYQSRAETEGNAAAGGGEYLLGINMDRLTRKERVGICETLIQQDYVKEAWARILRYGSEDIKKTRLLKMCSQMILQQIFDEDEPLLTLACDLFSKGKHDGVMLDYLCEYFNGSGKQMYKILNQAVRERVEVYDLPERLLAQQLFTGETDRMDQVFDWYAAGKKTGETLVKAYFTMKSSEYFLKGCPTKDRVFEYLEGAIEGITDFDKVPVVYLLALSRYYATLPVLEGHRLKMCQAAVGYLMSEGMVFSWFRDLGKWIPMPDSIMEQVMVEYQGDRNSTPALQVRILPEEEEYHWEEMRRVYPDIFVRQKVLFEGEILEYRVYEKKEETLTLVKEGSLSWEPDGQKKEGSRFVSLNEIGLCLALKEEGALKEKMRCYVEDSVVMEELFQVM